MARETDKRIRLVNAAKVLFHKQGFNVTTLADIAQDAKVPLGNVYYYFKTKELIAEAVLSNHNRELLDTIKILEESKNIKDSLLGYLQFEIDNIEQIVTSGCPIGGLCQELAKQDGSLTISATKILNDTLLWVEKQFQGLGLEKDSRELAMQFIAIIQGHALLTHTFKDPKILMQLKPILSIWIDKVISAKSISIPIEKIEEYI
ncbi:MAG: TetR/AcrR family transcriptional regulator [Legionellales bacterium]|jgi:AcrR family transcriptional regulator